LHALQHTPLGVQTLQRGAKNQRNPWSHNGLTSLHACVAFSMPGCKPEKFASRPHVTQYADNGHPDRGCCTKAKWISLIAFRPHDTHLAAIGPSQKRDIFDFRRVAGALLARTEHGY
jgi:hypothetical protein